MNIQTTTQNPKRWAALLPLAGIIPAIASPLIVAAGGKSLVLVSFGCWLFLMGIGLWLARKRLNVRLSPIVIFMLCFAGVVASAMGVFLR